MEIYRTRSFEHDVIRLPSTVQTRFAKQLDFFLDNPFHPSLHTKKMGGTSDIWEARVTKGYRFTFSVQSQMCVLRRIGTHNILRNP